MTESSKNPSSMDRPKKPAAIPVSPLAPSPQVTISEDNSRVTANLPTGERVEILLYGATVISWKSANGKENLFLSDKAHLDGSKPVRGGIPLVFPNFGPPQKDHPTGQLPQHGFARTSRWEYLGKTSSESSASSKGSGDSSVKLDFGLSNSQVGNAKWDYHFALTYSVTLSTEDLETTLVVRNTGEKNYDFQVLFHSYFRIDDIDHTTITGLESASYHDKITKNGSSPPAKSPIKISSETDRVYTSDPSQPITVIENGKPRFEFTRDMLSDIVVWNPWETKAESMADFRPVELYQKMVCVECGSVNGWNTLEAGDTWEGGQRIKAVW